MCKSKKGITLIALVITIIVLLILAAISINMLTGENSILSKAGEARERTERGQVEENIKIAYTAGTIDNTTAGRAIEDTMDEELEKTYGEGNVDVYNGGEEFVVDIEGRGEYILKASGEVRKGTSNEPVTNPHAPEEWVMAWIAKDGQWQSGTITSRNEEDLAGADIVAKLYTGTRQITPKDFYENELESGNEYYLYIEANGNKEMPDLVDNNKQIMAWQKGMIEYYEQGDTEEEIITPYITEVYVCDGVTSVGDCFLFGAISLNSVQISNTVESIGEDAFYSTSILSVTIPGNVKNIDFGAFYGCKFLKNLVIKKGVETIGWSAFCYCESLTNVSIPESVERIMNNAFGRSGLKNVTVKAKNIGYQAFMDCKDLTSIKISGNVQVIESGAFCGLSSLENLDIENGVKEIDFRAFGNCSKLKSVTIPSSVTKIFGRLFDGCESLEIIKILSADLEKVEQMVFGEINEDCVIYVLNEDVKQKLVKAGKVDTSMIRVVTLDEMNKI